MYSVILMTAMSAGAPEVPQFGGHRRGGCVGATSCYGYSSCYGCAGAGSGCYGGCYGGGRAHVPYGYSCAGSGSLRYAAAGCGGWHFYAPYIPPGSGGRVGYVPGYGYRVAPIPAQRVSSDVWGADYRYSASVPFPPAAKPTGDQRETKPELKGTARLLIELPADAKLFIDGALVNSSIGVRQFHTPTLAEGQTFFYDLRVETVRDAKPVAQTKRVYVRANEVVRESFRASMEAPSIASK